MSQAGNKPDIEVELQRFPVSVVAEYRKAREFVVQRLSPKDAQEWAEEGVGLAQHSFRSWEAATEYFRVTPQIIERLTFPQVVEWARWGRSLSSDSPVISSSFFRASPEALRHIVPEEMGPWARLGRSLYKGTWKSSSLASSYFEASPRLLSEVDMGELEELVGFIDGLSHKSYDLASECLAMADGVFSRIDREDRSSFLSLGAVLAQGNWRDVKPYFESGAGMLTKVEKSQRGRFLHLAERLSRETASNVVPFLTDSAAALGEIAPDQHGEMLSLAERLADASPGAVGEFLRRVPQVLGRVHGENLERWFGEGLKILKENEDGGLAFFRLESGRAEQALESLTSGLALDGVREVLTMYCRALAGEGVEIKFTQDLKEKGIGWNSAEQPTTEGRNIYLPEFVEHYSTKSENFSWFKVISTHQVGHLEYGSFRFQFDRPSTIFHAQEQRSVIAPSQGGSKESPVDLERFFDLFADRRLAADIFGLIEDGRVDHLIKTEYQGIKEQYTIIQEEAISQRPSPEGLPLREALVEILVRVSLQDPGSVMVPKDMQEHVDAIITLAKAIQRDEAAVEDTAEATIRLYDIVSQIPNVVMDPADYEERDMDQSGEGAGGDDIDQQVQNIMQGASGSGEPPEGKEEQDYKSPQRVEFRGEFKPELVQALENLRNDPSKARNAMDQTQLSSEELQQMLQKSVEVDVSEVEEGDLESSGKFIDNLMQEAARERSKSRQGTQFPHIPEDDQPLADAEPETFLYDEWDYRAGDYKPRWCCVREKRMEEGTEDFYDKTLRNHRSLVTKITKQFEALAPEMLRKIKHLPDGDEYDFDLVVEAMIQGMAGDTPSDKIYWRRNKVQRDVAVCFLLDMSASTAEAVDEQRRQFDAWDFPDDPRDYMTWLRNRREEMTRRTYKRIIDIEKESVILLIRALEAIGDRYGIYGFSGYGRENVEFYVVKDIDEKFGDHVKRRLDKITPMHATRMGPAIRHAITKLDQEEARTKILFLLSDGRPQDRGYSREGVEKEYAVHDTRMALNEARRKHITPFCLTVDRSGHDYLKTMCSDMGYEVVTDIHSLPERLPQLYRRLTG
ncbi:MAG: VWA domain-containing protein [Chloroflexi bacterium]|nr:VWA domain-containing protein [Chloroflexota bacterium]